MPSLALQQVSSRFAIENASKTLEKPVALKYLNKYLTESQRTTLAQHFPYETGHVWGLKLERAHQMERMAFRQCVVLFRRGQTVYKCGVLKCLIVNEELAEALWGRDEDCETWPIVYFLEKVRDVSIPASEVNQLLGRKANDNWQGFNTVDGREVDVVIEHVRARLT